MPLGLFNVSTNTHSSLIFTTSKFSTLLYAYVFCLHLNFKYRIPENETAFPLVHTTSVNWLHEKLDSTYLQQRQTYNITDTSSQEK